MTLSAEAGLLARLIRQSFRQPSVVGADIAALRLDRATLWQGLALVTVLSVLTLALVGGGATASPFAGGGPISPYASTMVLGASLTMLVFAIYFTGRALGGQGSFPAALALVIWFEVLAMTLRLGVALATLLLGPLAGPLPLVAMALLVWVLVNFIGALHGFALGRAAATLVLAILGLGLGLMLILAAIDILSGGALSHA